MTDDRPQKPAWIRHPGCGWRVFNDPIDIEHHGRNCPALLARKIKNLETAVEKLTKVEAPPAPSVDIDEVGEWPEEEDEPEQVSQYAGEDVASTVTTSSPEPDGWDDDDHSMASRPIGYSPIV